MSAVAPTAVPGGIIYSFARLPSKISIITAANLDRFRSDLSLLPGIRKRGFTRLNDGRPRHHLIVKDGSEFKLNANPGETGTNQLLDACTKIMFSFQGKYYNGSYMDLCTHELYHAGGQTFEAFKFYINSANLNYLHPFSGRHAYYLTARNEPAYSDYERVGNGALVFSASQGAFDAAFIAANFLRQVEQTVCLALFGQKPQRTKQERTKERDRRIAELDSALRRRNTELEQMRRDLAGIKHD